MFDLLEFIVGLADLWYLRRVVAFFAMCFGLFYAYDFLFVQLPGPGGSTSDLMSGLGCVVVAAFFGWLTFRRRNEST